MTKTQQIRKWGSVVRKWTLYYTLHIRTTHHVITIHILYYYVPQVKYMYLQSDYCCLLKSQLYDIIFPILKHHVSFECYTRMYFSRNRPPRMHISSNERMTRPWPRDLDKFILDLDAVVLKMYWLPKIQFIGQGIQRLKPE